MRINESRFRLHNSLGFTMEQLSEEFEISIEHVECFLDKLKLTYNIPMGLTAKEYKKQLKDNAGLRIPIAV